MSKRPGDLGYAAGWCIHYRYNRGLKKGEPNTCEAGVNYEQWRGVPHATQPCFLDDKTGESKPDALPCEHLRRPTAEEITLHEEWLEAESEVMPDETAGRDLSASRTSPAYDTRPPLEGVDRLDPIDEIAVLTRSLTYGEMMELASGIGIDPAILHKWAVGHGSNQ